MRFAHISDLHIDSAKQVIYGVNPCKNLEKALAVLSGIKDLDAIILSGDISNDGKEASFLQADAMLSEISVPVYCVLGNHDSRLVVERLLEERKLKALRFVKDVVLAGYKFLFLNSVKEESPEENMSRGFISCDDLERIDSEASLFPGNCILVMHHPALEVDGWMDARILLRFEGTFLNQFLPHTIVGTKIDMLKELSIEHLVDHARGFPTIDCDCVLTLCSGNHTDCQKH